MASKYRLKCEVCEKAQSFHDEKDIGQCHWTIIAWEIESNQPRVTCPKCDYPVNKITKYKNTENGNN